MYAQGLSSRDFAKNSDEYDRGFSSAYEAALVQ